MRRLCRRRVAPPTTRAALDGSGTVMGTVAGPIGPILTGVETINISAGNVEYSFGPARVRIKTGTSLTFTNTGDIPHTATAMAQGAWDTGVLAKGESKKITFTKPGNYYYICTPHPWMYGQVIVEE